MDYIEKKEQVTERKKIMQMINKEKFVRTAETENFTQTAENKKNGGNQRNKIGNQRNEIRKEKKTLRNDLSTEARCQKSFEVCEKLAQLNIIKNASCIMVYNCIGSELDLSFLIDNGIMRGKKTVYPVCIDECNMKAYATAETEIRTGRTEKNKKSCGNGITKGMRVGAYGIVEPDPDISEETDPELIDVVICPGIAFDDKGNRLGWGKGYYDRFLKKCKNAYVLMAAFEIQHAAYIPSHENDVKMHMVVTEKEIYDFTGEF